MYIFDGKTGAREMAIFGAKNRELDAYWLDAQFSRRLVKRFVPSSGRTGASDDWEPNQMLKKRDFQEIDPPKTREEFFARYKPSVGWGTAIVLGSCIFLMLFQVIIKWVYKQWKVFKGTKFFAKIFSLNKMSPSAQQIPASFISEHRRKSSVKRRRSLAEVARSTAEVHFQDPNLNIKVHVIGPTPSVSQKCLTAEEFQPNLDSPGGDTVDNANTTSITTTNTTCDTSSALTGIVRNCDYSENNNKINNKDNPVAAVITRATIELRPLLEPSVTAEGGFDPGQEQDNYCKVFSHSEGNLVTTMPLVHESTFGKKNAAIRCGGSDVLLNDRNGNLNKLRSE